MSMIRHWEVTEGPVFPFTPPIDLKSLPHGGPAKAPELISIAAEIAMIFWIFIFLYP